MNEKTPIIDKGKNNHEKEETKIEAVEKEKSTEKISIEIVEQVQSLFKHTVESHLEKNSELRNSILNYYDETDRIQTELSNIFKNQTEEEILHKIKQMENKFKDPVFFIEHYQKIFERNNTFKRLKERTESDPIATDVEYSIGTYAEGLEYQVKDAVFKLHKKGFNLFESGFDEKKEREQFIGMHNMKINIPEEIIDYFQNKSFKINIEYLHDRIQVHVTPENEDPITLDKWKEFWDEFAELIPKAESESFNNIDIPTLHSDFRAKQDSLKNIGLENL